MLSELHKVNFSAKDKSNASVDLEFKFDIEGKFYDSNWLKLTGNARSVVGSVKMARTLVAEANLLMSMAGCKESLINFSPPGHEFELEEDDALHRSILHWSENEHKKIRGMDMLTADVHCACCQLSLERTQEVENNPDLTLADRDCDLCPIGEYTEKASCEGTPYAGASTDPTELRIWLEQLYCGFEPEVF